MTHLKAALAFLLVLPAAALAHAFPDHASPAVGAEVTTKPTEVQIWFDQELSKDCSIQVQSADGTQIDLKDSKIDPKDKTLLTVSLPKDLKPGIYKVLWQVTSVDTHMNSGDFTFTYKIAPVTTQKK